MELYLDNIGIIKDSKILLDGLTVITGKNSSGKTTVGKVMYSLLSAGSDLEEAFEFSKKRYIVSKLTDIERILKLRRYRRMHRDESNDIFRLLDMISMHTFARFSLNKLILFLSDTKEILIQLEIEDYLTYIGSTQTYSNLTEAINQDFPQWKQKCIDICETALFVINDENAFYNLLLKINDFYKKKFFFCCGTSNEINYWKSPYVFCFDCKKLICVECFTFHRTHYYFDFCCIIKYKHANIHSTLSNFSNYSEEDDKQVEDSVLKNLLWKLHETKSQQIQQFSVFDAVDL